MNISDRHVRERVEAEVEGVRQRRFRRRCPSYGLEGQHEVTDGPREQAESEDQRRRPSPSPDYSPSLCTKRWLSSSMAQTTQPSSHVQ